MKFEAINKKFTEAVMEWLAKGYHFNASTMSGHQGEIGRVDLTNGKEIIRILVDRFTERDPDFLDGVELVVGRDTRGTELDVESTFYTIWNKELEVLSRERFYHVGKAAGDNWYGTKEEARRASKISYTRYCAKASYASWMLGPKAGKIVLDKVRKQRGCSRAKASEIKVEKRVYESRAHYIAYYGCKTIQLA